MVRYGLRIGSLSRFYYPGFSRSYKLAWAYFSYILNLGFHCRHDPYISLIGVITDISTELLSNGYRFGVSESGRISGDDSCSRSGIVSG